MERAITELAQLSDDELFEVLDEGFWHLGDSIDNLTQAGSALSEPAYSQARAVIRSLLEEESAKVLILLDFIRCPKALGAARSRTLKSFYDHLAKGIYADSCEWRPVNFEEVTRHVSRMRQPYYLDGPNDVDWIFPNDVVYQRESGMYVDYVRESGQEGRRFWDHPRQDHASLWRSSSNVMRLARSMGQAGLLRRDALKIVASVWRSLDISPVTHWTEIEQKNIETIQIIRDAGLIEPSKEEHFDTIVGLWPFPMYSIDVRRMPTNERERVRNDLRAIQENWATDY